MTANSIDSNHYKPLGLQNNNINVESEKNISDREYQQRLIRLYIDYVNRTGKVDYPPLKKFFKKLVTTDIDSTESYEKEDFATETIKYIVVDLTGIRYRVNEIASEIRSIFGKIDYAQMEDIQPSIQRSLFVKIKTKYRELDRHIEQLIKINNKYDFLTQSASSKLLEDLQYFRLYIQQYLEQLVTEKSEVKSGNRNRFMRYLDELVDRVYSLTNLLSQNLEYEIESGKK